MKYPAFALLAFIALSTHTDSLENEDKSWPSDFPNANRKEGGTGPQGQIYFVQKGPLNVTSKLGGVTELDCQVNGLGDKTVSWMRKTEEGVKLLTYGLLTYIDDEKYTLNFEHPNNWKLQIHDTKKLDEGTYVCQLTTHPPTTLSVHLRVVAPTVEIFDQNDQKVENKFYTPNQTIQLKCVINQMPQADTYVLWRHQNKILNYDLQRGGVSVKTDMSGSEILSTLRIAGARMDDSGYYWCSLGDVAYSGVNVHVVQRGDETTNRKWQKDDQPAAMELGCGNAGLCCFYLVFLPLLATTTNQFYHFCR